MGRPPRDSAGDEDQGRAGGARRGGVGRGGRVEDKRVSEQSIHRWKADFVEAGKTAQTVGRSGSSTGEAQLEA